MPLFRQLHSTLNEHRRHQDNLVLRREMALERADRRHGVVRGNLVHPGLAGNRCHHLYAGNVCGENVVACLGISQTPDPETPCFIGIPLDERTAIAIVTNGVSRLQTNKR